MIIRSLLYAVGVYVLTAIIALLVAGIILLIYKIVHRNKIVQREEDKNKAKEAEVKPVSQIVGKEG